MIAQQFIIPVLNAIKKWKRINMNEQFKIKLRGDALVCIDWANVYGWQKKLKWRIDAGKLLRYFKNYTAIKKIREFVENKYSREIAPPGVI